MEQLAAGSHSARFFERRAYPADQIAALLKEGLEHGCFVFAIATRNHLDAIGAALAVLGVDRDPYVKGGQLLLEEASEIATAMLRSKADRADFDALIGQQVKSGIERFGRAVGYGEAVDELVRAGETECCLALEGLWKEFLAEYPLELWCGYTLDDFVGRDSCSAFRQVCDGHSHVECQPAEELESGRMAAELYQSRAAFEHEAAERRSAERDLTHAYDDLARAYETTRTACERADRASRIKDEFMARLGHELRNPLSPILVAAELMARRAPETHRSELTVIERQARHLMGLIDDLMDVARITTGRVELTRRRVELGGMVSDAVEIVRPLLHEHRHELVLDVPPRGLAVDGDQQRLTQVLVNLLSNALRYTPDGGQIRVEAFRAGSSATLTVSDDGVGLEPELKSRIFELFEQGLQSSARPQGGLGLGLPIAYNLVELHGGRLHAFSDGPGRGSTFEVVLPLSSSSSERPGPRSTRPSASRPLDVLVIDDNGDLATLFAESLRENGHRVEVALDGGAALKIAKYFRPDVALLDLGLPDIDGCELGVRLKAEFALRELKLVAISGYGQDADLQRTRAAGFDLHLVKPVPLADLEGVLASLFAESRVA